METLIDKDSIQNQINTFATEYKNNKILIYGAGKFSEEVFRNCDLSGLNIIGVMDKKFADSNSKFHGYKAFSPDLVNNIDYDKILSFLRHPHPAIESLGLEDNCLLFEQYTEVDKSEKCIICSSNHLKGTPVKIAQLLMDLMFNFKIKDDTLLLKCPNCGAYFYKRRPSEEEASRYYKDYNSEKYHSLRKKYEPHMYDENYKYSYHTYDKYCIENNRKYAIANEIKKFINVSDNWNVLDWGGSGDIFINDFENANKFTYDINKTYDKQNKNRVIGKMDKEYKNYFDFIMSTQVLEHVSYPKESVKEMVSLLKTGGYLFISVPYEKIIDDKYGVCIPGMHEHITMFSKKSLEILLKDANLKILLLKGAHYSYVAPAFNGMFIVLAQKI